MERSKVAHEAALQANAKKTPEMKAIMDAELKAEKKKARENDVNAMADALIAAAKSVAKESRRNAAYDRMNDLWSQCGSYH